MVAKPSLLNETMRKVLHLISLSITYLKKRVVYIRPTSDISDMIELNHSEFYKNCRVQKRGATSDVEYVQLMRTCVTNLHQRVTKYF
jgi:hypothetical protein